MGVFKKTAAEQSFVQEVVSRALQAAPVVVTRLGAYEDSSSIASSNISRFARLWAVQNQGALRYAGLGLEEAQAKVTAEESRVRAHKTAAAEADIKLLQQTGGLVGQQIAAQAGMEPAFDPALLATRKEETKKAETASLDLADARRDLEAAMSHDRAKADLVGILAALLGDLQ